MLRRGIALGYLVASSACGRPRWSTAFGLVEVLRGDDHDHDQTTTRPRPDHDPPTTRPRPASFTKTKRLDFTSLPQPDY